MPTPDDPADSAVERIEADRERAGESGDELGRAVDRHRAELDTPPEPADGENATPDQG